MHRLPFWFLLPALVTGRPAEPPPLLSTLEARRAAAMLGPSLWQRVLVIRNTGRTDVYPTTFAAVVFEMGGILWFYCPVDGTQSLSIRRGQAAADERNLGPLLREIDPGFAHWDVLPPDDRPLPPGPVPPNACFLECLALLRGRLLAGVPTEMPRLLSYYIAVPGGVSGHTVLYFQGREGPIVIDPHFPKGRRRIGSARPDDARSVAACLRRDIVSARWVPVDPPGLTGGARPSLQASLP
jgi:hypothetical protein